MNFELKRYINNPIIKPEDLPFKCYAVMNSGATIYNGKVLLLLRAENHARQTKFHVATSENGIDFEICKDTIDYPLTENEKRYGAAHRFDMRITCLEGVYYVLHAAWLNDFGCSIGMAKTEDFKYFEPFPYLSVPSNRNAVLFPEKIGGLYARLERPQKDNGTGEIWISYSKDLEFWGRAMPLNVKRKAWNHGHNGAGAIPIKTEQGWLHIYHATAPAASTTNYYLGAMLTDLNDPSKIIAEPEEFILAAEKDYECVGQTPNVVFTSGAVIMPDGTLNIYYGGADTRMCLAQTTVQELVDFCLESK